MNLKELAPAIHAANKAKGFWDNDRTLPEVGLLINTEISEAVEALRKGDLPSSKDSSIKEFDFELADVIIRCMDAVIGFEVHPDGCDYDAKLFYVDEFDELDFEETMLGLWQCTSHVREFIERIDGVINYDPAENYDPVYYVTGCFNVICDDLFEIAAYRGVNLLTVIQRKLEINAARPRLHGKAF